MQIIIHSILTFQKYRSLHKLQLWYYNYYFYNLQTACKNNRKLLQFFVQVCSNALPFN